MSQTHETTEADHCSQDQTQQTGALRQDPILEKAMPWTDTDFSQAGWKVVRCLETRFVYLLNPPDYSAYAEDYAWEKTYEQEKKRRQLQEPVRASFSAVIKRWRAASGRGDKMAYEALYFLKRINDKMPLAGDKKAGFRVADIGCGEGRHVQTIAELALQLYGLQVQPVGLEISDYLAKVAQERLKQYGGFVIHQPALEGMASLDDFSLDVIILNSFLEHEVNPAPLLRACTQKLSKQGVIIVKVPNFNSWNRHLRGKNWCGFRWPDHVNYFTPGTLRLLVERVGLRVLRMNLMDRMPTSDNMWAVLQRSAAMT